MPTGNPTDAQILATKPVKQAEVFQRRYGDGYLFASGILELEHSNVLSVLFPHYYSTSLLEKIGYYEPITRDYWTWSELDRTRKSAEITAGGGGTGATATLTTDVAVTTGQGDGYFIQGDTIMTTTGLVLRVDAVAAAGGFQTITVSKPDGTNFVATDVVDGSRVGHVGSSFEEGSMGPKGRLYLPNERHNKTTILRRSCVITGTALTQKVYFGDHSWAWHNELIDLEEFRKDQENTIVFSQMSADAPDIAQRGDGIITQLLTGAVQTTFAGSVTEQSIQENITRLLVSSPADEYVVFCGSKYITDATNALRDYSMDGAVDYGVFGRVNVVGLDLNAYRFAGKVIYFIHYPTFDDLETLPGTVASATDIDFSNFSMWLNLGTQNGKKLISMKYPELAGYQRKFVYKYQFGMMGDTPDIGESFDGLKTHMLSEIGVEVRCLNQHALHYANG